jgi:hypothetical protein
VNKAEIRAEYRRLLAAADFMQTCCYCKTKAGKTRLEPHHPNGRHGLNLLDFKWAHATCHRLDRTSIHESPALAKKLGLYH